MQVKFGKISNFASEKATENGERRKSSILAQHCGLLDQMTEEQLEFIDFMVPMNIEARYPEYKQNLATHLNEQVSLDIIDKTKQFKQWILQKF